jgi:hypothetical protein
MSLPPNKGCGECRALNAPTASRVKCKKTHELVTTGPPDSPDIPARDGFNVYFVLSPVIGLFDTVIGKENFADLTPTTEASGPHDFAVRELQRSSALPRVHRIPHPTSVTIAKRPF